MNTHLVNPTYEEDYNEEYDVFEEQYLIHYIDKDGIMTNIKPVEGEAWIVNGYGHYDYYISSGLHWHLLPDILPVFTSKTPFQPTVVLHYPKWDYCSWYANTCHFIDRDFDGKHS